MPRPREFDPDAVVDTAVDVFLSGGFTATSTDNLCERTGVSRSSLYNTFKSKRDLYEQALRRYCERSRTDLAVLADRPGPVRTVLRDFLLDAAESQFADPQRRGCLALSAAVEIGMDDPGVADLARRDFDHLVESFRALIERGQRDGEISPDRDALALARLVHASLVAIHAVGRVADERSRVTDIIDALLETL